jgi:hypothetical protein
MTHHRSPLTWIQHLIVIVACCAPTMLNAAAKEADISASFRKAIACADVDAVKSLLAQRADPNALLAGAPEAYPLTAAAWNKSCLNQQKKQAHWDAMLDILLKAEANYSSSYKQLCKFLNEVFGSPAHWDPSKDSWNHSERRMARTTAHFHSAINTLMLAQIRFLDNKDQQPAAAAAAFAAQQALPAHTPAAPAQQAPQPAAAPGAQKPEEKKS